MQKMDGSSRQQSSTPFACILRLCIPFVLASGHTASPTPCHTDVLVLGAGMAGAKAAADLTKEGLKVLVLEQSSYIGGRMRLEKFGGEGIELGANWIEGIPQKENPIWKMAQAIGVRTMD